MLLSEEWRQVVGYEGLYEVSNLGNVRSLNYANRGYVKNLTPTLKNHGYLDVCLSKGKSQRCIRVHRLVAMAFLDNPNSLPQVNHINENKLDNRVENLEWVPSKQNVNHGTRNERMARSKLNHNCKAVIQMDLQGNIIRKWVSLHEVERQRGFDVTHISRACKGIQKSAYGYKWRFAA